MIDDLTRSILEQRDNIENQRNRELNSNREHYIKQLETEIQQLKENNMSMQEEMARTWKKADLYKEVIEELNKFVEENYFHFDSYTGDGDFWLGEEQCFKLKEILDKAKGE